MATNNSINNTSNPLFTTAATIDPGSSGDSVVQYSINTTDEFRVGVDDTDDSFRISQGSALGTNDTFVMSDSGERTLPLQPMFQAVPSGVQSNVTGDNTIYDVLFQTENLDRGSNFVGSTGIFTAPAAGKYKFIVGLSFTGIATNHTNNPQYFRINGAGNQSEYWQNSFQFGGDVSGACTLTGEAYVSLAASDTFRAIGRFIGGSKVVDITTGSFFAGYLCT